MSELRIIAEDYVAMRRALGFKFSMKGSRLSRLVRWRQAEACCRRAGVKGDGRSPASRRDPKGP